MLIHVVFHEFIALSKARLEFCGVDSQLFVFFHIAFKLHLAPVRLDLHHSVQKALFHHVSFASDVFVPFTRAAGFLVTMLVIMTRNFVVLGHKPN